MSEFKLPPLKKAKRGEGPKLTDSGLLTKRIVKQVESYLPIILTRFKAGQDMEKVIRDIGQHAGVEPDMVAKYVQAVIKAGSSQAASGGSSLL
ncbi:hypothetical protein C5Y96_01440 [Blastopirellula marina]|uniref:Uncharacterized protein n=1 Tax=Blastopirellula marina TaxID=124 RepID=A0A2S8G812_9BACT|nr:hypothetical protein C5Y96_01440 [Blastopirellula marina]RCS55812.1 hypothetical protein DTL36_01440 [Bremerella cremea]